MGKETLHGTAKEFYDAMARAFPVCCVSDEFYYFPQVLPAERDWSAWDDFSAAAVSGFAGRLAGWEEAAEREPDSIDRSALLHSLRTLREQLTAVALHRRQPTWHLTVAAAGLLEALDSGEEKAWPGRIAGLPSFLVRGEECLDTVPYIFLEPALKMARSLGEWLGALRRRGLDTGSVEGALHDFAGALGRKEVTSSFRLAGDLPERIVSYHVGCGMNTDAAMGEILEEIDEMHGILGEETSRLAPGQTWIEAAERIPFETAGREGLLGLYRREADRLEKVCREASLLPTSFPAGDLLAVEKVPSFLAAVRASDSYGARPGHPARGGTFYVFCEERSGEGRTAEYRMTTAHETWPGHHLLDCARWSLPNPVRRCLERPLFYEGWACLAEEIIFRTGAWEGEWDRFLLARRRLKRAARGMVDLGLQSGRMGLDDAAVVLEEAGFSPGKARTAVEKYVLRPGYQVCYTLGLRKFLALLGKFEGTLPSFVDAVFAEGEIAFDDLEEALRRRKTQRGGSPPFYGGKKT
jgi:hypothetical protein